MGERAQQEAGVQALQRQVSDLKEQLAAVKVGGAGGRGLQEGCGGWTSSPLEIQNLGSFVRLAQPERRAGGPGRAF